MPVERAEAVRDELPRDALVAPLELAALRVPEERVAPELEDFARDDVDFLAPLAREDPLAEVVPRLVAERAPVERLVEDPLRDEEEREPLERAELPLEDEDEPDALPPEASLGLHLPDMTRCAASATASAISEPSLVALETTLLAACEAVSAASRPASRIFLRAAGLALIAAAAAARPAASISLLSAAFASLSTVLSPDPEPDEDELERELLELEWEELLRADLAIASLPPSGGKTL